MATAEEVLETMAEVPESAPVCVIDPETRTIIVPPDYQLFGVENDKRVERLYFQCPKIVGDNQDLSQEYQLFMNYQNANGDPDAYPIDDMEIDGDNITFSWLLEENVTKYRGNIQFAFGAIIPGDEAEDPDKNRWNTTINTDCTCLVGLKCTQQVAESNPDALVQIWAAIDELKAGGGGITEETDPTVPAWAKEPTKPTYTAVEVGADASGTAEAKVSVHNTAVDAHSDIRLLVQELTTRLNTLADSDDDTLDQMSEIVAYIKSNKSLIDAITTQKVSVTDIIDNLTTNVANKPLSAAQGVALKALIDGITIPEALPNPQKLIFTGAVTAEYDGSTQQTIYIPKGRGSDSYTLPIMSDTQLGGGKAVEKTDEDVPVAVDSSTGQLFVPTYPENTGGSADIPRQEMQDTDTTITLDPNKLYVFPEMTSLTVTLAEPSNTNVANEYHFFFTSGATATTLTLNDVLSDAYSIEANMKYEVSILEGVAYIKGVTTSET